MYLLFVNDFSVFHQEPTEQYNASQLGPYSQRILKVIHKAAETFTHENIELLN